MTNNLNIKELDIDVTKEFVENEQEVAKKLLDGVKEKLAIKEDEQMRQNRKNAAQQLLQIIQESNFPKKAEAESICTNIVNESIHKLTILHSFFEQKMEEQKKQSLKLQSELEVKNKQLKEFNEEYVKLGKYTRTLEMKLNEKEANG